MQAVSKPPILDNENRRRSARHDTRAEPPILSAMRGIAIHCTGVGLGPGKSRPHRGDTTKKRPGGRWFVCFLAEAVRFELTDGCPSPVFKTGAIDHSATLPALVFVTGESRHVAASPGSEKGPILRGRRASFGLLRGSPCPSLSSGPRRGRQGPYVHRAPLGQAQTAIVFDDSAYMPRDLSNASVSASEADAAGAAAGAAAAAWAMRASGSGASCGSKS